MREAVSVCQDDKQFIWASTKTGILRLTGNACKVYTLPLDKKGIISIKLLFDRASIWAYTNDGQIFVFNRLKDQFELQYNMRNLVKNNHFMLRKMIVDNSGKLYMASSLGFYIVDLKKIYTPPSLADIEIGDALKVNATTILLGTRKGIYFYHTDNDDCVPVFESQFPAVCSIEKLYYQEKREMIWIGTFSHGLFSFDLKSKKIANIAHCIPAFPSQPIMAIEFLSEYIMLVGIDGQGIWEIDTRFPKVVSVSKENLDEPTSLKGNGVHDIFKDCNNRVWVSTYNGGISYFDLEKPPMEKITHTIGSKNSLINNHVNAMIEDNFGNIWFATENGLSRWNVSMNKWDTFLSNMENQTSAFLSINKDEKGNIWAGTYSSGVYVVDPQFGTVMKHFRKGSTEQSIASDFIFDIFKDSQGDLWLGGTFGEFQCYLSKEKRFRKYHYQPVNAFLERRPNEILLLCTYGLCSLNKKSGDLKKIIDGYFIHDACLFSDSVAWICTRGDGLLKYEFKNGSIEQYSMKDGLPSNYICSVIAQGTDLWLGTEKGLCRFSTITKSVDVLSNLNHSFNQHAKIRLKSGMLYWGSNEGAIQFTPTKFKMQKEAGKLYFQDFFILGRSIVSDSIYKLTTVLDDIKKIELKYNQNSFSFDFLPISVKEQEYKYTWKLEGFGENWSALSDLRVINYTNIPSGKYRFIIKMIDSSHNRVIDQRNIDIQIFPPFWQTWWAWLIYISVFFSFLYFSFRYYIGSLKRKHSEDKIRFFINTAHDMRNSLTLIRVPVDELAKEKTLSANGIYFSSLAREQMQSLNAVVTQLLDFQKSDLKKTQLVIKNIDIVSLIKYRVTLFQPLAEKQGVLIHFICEIPSCIIALDEEKTEKILDNLLSNAIKYTPKKGTVDMELFLNNSNWVIEVRDTGMGIPKKEQSKLFSEFYRNENAINSKIIGSGIGLLLTKKYVEAQGGKISCESVQGVGSTFRIVFPRNKNMLMTPSLAEEIPLDVDDIRGVCDGTVESELEFALQEDVPNLEKQLLHPLLLIVEDNDDLRSLLVRMMNDEYNVEEASTGSEAWKKIMAKLPDMVLSDVMMPDMNGFDLCKRIKSSFESSHIPVILLTALSDKRNELYGNSLGADDYVAKPFDGDVLKSKLKSIFNNRIAIRNRALRMIEKPTEEPFFVNELNDHFIKKAIQVVYAHIADSDFGKDDFACAMNVSSSLLYKKIKSLTNQSPNDFIRFIRLKHAVELLQIQKYTITEISEMSGFSNVAYFSTVFKKHYGKSPTSFLEKK